MSDLIDELRGFSKAYPEDIFPPFTDEERTAYSVVISRASGAMGRHCAKHMARAADEIERLTAALRAQPGPVSLDDVEWAGKVHLAEAIRERDEARAERDALRIELDVCRSAIEDCYDIVETFDCYNDSDDACQRVTLRRLNEAIGKAAPRLLYERSEGQKLYGLRYRELMAERDALHAVATDAHRDIDELRRQLAEAELDAERYRWLRANREFCVAAYPEGEWGIPAGMVFLGYSNPDADSWIDAARSLESSNE